MIDSDANALLALGSLGDVEEDLRRVHLKLDEFARVMRPELRQAESWPVYNDEYGGIMCGREGHGCEMEQEIILTPFKDLTYPQFPPYTARELLDAIEAHIEQQRYRDEEED